MNARLTYRQIHPPPASGQPGVSFSGSISSSWMGRRARGLPRVGACPAAMPRAPALALRFSVGRTTAVPRVTVTVTADIHGDRRPVQGARVALDGQVRSTSRRGAVTFSVPPSGSLTARASAGDTFRSVTRTIVILRR